VHKDDLFNIIYLKTAVLGLFMVVD